MEIVVGLLFLFWLICTLLAQGNRVKILKFDYLVLLPICRFFCPVPVSKDINIYVKGICVDENEILPWRPLFYLEKKKTCFLLNPQLRIAKSINTTFRQLKPYMDQPGTVHFSTPYLSILNVASSIFQDDSKVKSVQFMIVGYSGFEDDTKELMFLSNVHSL
jgi:hypothetical protein